MNHPAASFYYAYGYAYWHGPARFGCREVRA